MKHLAIYREFRPKTFDEVVGQENIVKTLKNQVKSGSFAHAYLFCGTRGTGKTSVAKIFAKSINCENNVDGSPCGNCLSCSQSENFDIIEIDAASNNGVDKIRELRENIKFLPLNSKYKVYIIDEVHMLSEGAFNALLKTLEEPPSHAVFILATTEVQKLPQTILSRCIRFDFKLVTKPVLEKLMKDIFAKLKVKYDEQSLDIISTAAEGSVRDCLSISDRCVSFTDGNLTYQKVLEVLGGISKDIILDLTSEIVNADMQSVNEKLNKLLNDGKSVNNLIKELLTVFKDLTIIKTCTKDASINLISFPKSFFDKLAEISENVTKSNLEQCLDILSRLETEIKTSTLSNLLLTVAVIKLVLICENKQMQKKIEVCNIIKDAKLNNMYVSDEDTSKKKVNFEVDNESLDTETKVERNEADFKSVLGRLLIELRESSNVALAMIMSDIAEGKIESGVFTIYCKKEDEKFLNNNKDIFVTGLRNIAENYDFVAVGVEERKNGDLELKLTKMFGDKLKIE